MAYTYWIISFIFIYRSLFLSYFISTSIYDARFFTYFNYTFVTTSLALLILSMWNMNSYKLYVLFLLPLTYGTVIFVAFAIVVIVELNDWVFLKTSTFNGGTKTIGLIHTGDFIIHYLPLFEILLVLLLLDRSAVPIFKNFYASLRPSSKVYYTIYFLLSSLFLILLYMINMDFASNYPTSLPIASTIALVVVMAILFQSLLFGIWSRKLLERKEETPVGRI